VFRECHNSDDSDKPKRWYGHLYKWYIFGDILGEYGK
jgi:hypothetical protein